MNISFPLIRQHPFFGNGSHQTLCLRDGESIPIKYDIGTVVEEPAAVKSDKQCDAGLHVFRQGIRPEFIGLCEANHKLICLEVEINQEDICFGGLPGNDMKLRVKKLKVLRQIKDK